jgi:PPM family protein phosphatase
LEAFGLSETGPVRRTNEDCFVSDGDLRLFVVADGMGGHNAGEVASHLAVETIRDFIAESATATDITWPFGLETKSSIDTNRLTTAVRLANRKIYNEGAKSPDLSGMGTTVVAALVAGDRMTIVSVGDSRLYRLRQGALEQLTKDDTWLASVLGEKQAEDADPQHPLRHVLTSVVGTKDDVKPGSREEQLVAGDRFLLCTDGIHGKLDSGSLTNLLLTAPSASDGAESVVKEAITRGTSDNATALVINVA